MKLIEAAHIEEVANHAYHEWELAMAAADGNKEVNLCFKRQELCKCVAAIAQAAPAADAELIRHAHWDMKSSSPYGNIYECSLCGRELHSRLKGNDLLSEYPYCHCGAKIEAEAENREVD